MSSAIFDDIFPADGTCHIWDCRRPGVVLAYDDMSPECATWFCPDCWDWFEETCCIILHIAIDRRYIAPPYQLSAPAESRWLEYKELPEPQKEPEIRIWATSTDMVGTEHERRKYYVILKDEGVETNLILEVHANKTVVAVPYAAVDYDEYDDDGLYPHEEDYYITEEDWEEEDNEVIYYE